MPEQKQTQKTIIAVGFNGAAVPKKAEDLIGGKSFSTFRTFRKISGCNMFLAGNLASFTGPNGELHNPATAKDKDGKLIIQEWRKDGDLIIGEI